MSAKSSSEAFGALPRQQQAERLARWLHAATVDARGTYIAGTEGIADPVRLRGFNELQHRLSGQIVKILAGDEDRYPDDVFLAMVLEAARELHADLLEKEVAKLDTAGGSGAARRQRRAG